MQLIEMIVNKHFTTKVLITVINSIEKQMDDAPDTITRTKALE